jgi:hypothetical protein
MRIRVKKSHPALKHGGYSATSILPGENVAEFEKLHRALIAELTPNGALEDDIIATMARLVWRKQNLATFRIAELARGRYEKIESETVPRNDRLYSLPKMTMTEEDVAEYQAAMRDAENQAREELGDAYDLVEIGETATVDRLLEDLEVQDRLDAMIDKCLKRLLFLRGLKSISTGAASATPRRIQGPSRAA